MPENYALITRHGSTLGLYDLDDAETEPGAVIRRAGSLTGA